MAKYHLKDNGEPGECNAGPGRCPKKNSDGSLQEHYNTPEEATKAFEKANKEKVSTSLSKNSKKTPEPIILEPARPMRKFIHISDLVDYDFDDTQCADPDGCAEDIICRDREYVGLHTSGWLSDNPIEEHARNVLNLPHDEPLPDEVKSIISRYDEDELLDEVEIYTDPGYYGDEIEMDLDDSGINGELEKYYWDQPNANDDDGVMSYLRGKGFDTSGLTPREAIEESLRNEEAIPKSRSLKVDKVGVSNIQLKNIRRPNKTRVTEGCKNPKALTKVKGAGANHKIAGVLLKHDHGDYELLDGYKRTAFLDGKGRKGANFIILTEPKKRIWARRRAS